MHPRHLLQLLVLSATWGGSFVLLRIASPALGPWVLGGVRCALAAVAFAVLLRALRQPWPPWHAWPELAAVSLLTVAAPFVLFPIAALHVPAGYSAVLNATSPMFSVMTAAAMGDEKLTLRKALGCAVGFGGVLLLVRLGPIEPSMSVLLAALACIAAAATYGVGAVWMRRVAVRHSPLSASAAVHVSAMAILAGPTIVALPWARPTIAAVLALLFLGIATSGLMYWLSMRLMREVSTSAATSSAFLIPVFGIVWGSIFLNEPLGKGMLPGCVAILFAIVLVTGANPIRFLLVRDRGRRKT